MQQWVAIGGVAQGRSHVKENIPCQDNIFMQQSNEVSVIVLADGAGSARLSHYGSFTTVHVVGKYLLNHFDDLYHNNDASAVAQDLITVALEKLKNLANEKEADISDFASTLLFVAVKQDKCLIGRLGDGVIGGQTKTGESIILAKEEKLGAVNETVFITTKNAQRYFKLYRSNLNHQGFLIMSDGTESSMVDKTQKDSLNFSKGVDRLFLWLEENNLLDVQRALEHTLSNQVIMRTQDDCALVMMKLVDMNTIFESKSLYERIAIFSSYASRKRQLEAIDLTKALLDILKTPCTLEYVHQQLSTYHLSIDKIIQHLKDYKIIEVNGNIISLSKI